MRDDFSACGEMGRRMAEAPWAGTPLGPPADWPQSLRTAVGIMLSSRYAMFVWWGRDLVNLYNDAYRPFLGEKHPQALGQSARDVWAEIWDLIGPRTEAVLTRGESTFDEALLLLMEPNGYPEETYFTFSYSPIRDDRGEVGGLFGAVTDETQRVIGERRLRTLREVAAAVSETKSPDEACAAAAGCMSQSARDIPFALVYLTDGEGGEARLAAHVGVTPGSPGAEERMDLAGEGAPWPLADAVADGQLRVVDDVAARLAHPPSGDWDRPPTRAAIVPLAEQGKPAVAGFLIVGLNPYLRFDEEYRGFLGVLGGQIASGVANARAYQAERRRAEALAEIDAAKTAFFSNVSHEFRTPLTLMLSPLEELLSRPGEETLEMGRGLLSVAHRNALRLRRLVDAVLDFSRIEAGRVKARYEPTDVAALTIELASNFRSAIESAGLELVVDCPTLSDPVFVDRDMWEKIVLNLLSNAFKFTFQGRIAVRLRQEGDAVELSVEDTGVGVAAQDLPRLFERFHRIENAHGRSIEGTGIGLALVQELARLHGGRVAVESEPGVGSVFRVSIPRGCGHLAADCVVREAVERPAGPRAQVFVEEALRWLPAADGAPAPALGADAPDPAGGGRRVLLADDNADMRQYVSRLLSAEGYEVETATDGEAALSAARSRPPDLVLTDVMMPRLDGLGLLRALRADPHTAETPIVLLSARAGEEAKVEGLQSGADDYLVKPFSPRELLARVQAAIRLAEVRRAADRAMREESLRVLRLFEKAPGFMCVLRGPDHAFEFANAAYRRVVGGRDIIGRTVREAIPEVVDQGWIDLLDRVYAGERFVGEAVPVRLDTGPGGTPVTALLDFIYEPIVEADGKISGVFVEGYEVTDRVRAEQALRRSEAQLRLAAEAAEIGLWDLDLITGALYWQPRVKAMFGISPDAPITLDGFFAGVHPEDRDATAAAYEAAIDPARRAPYDVEFRAIGREDGVVRWVASKGRAAFDDEGRCVRCIGAAIDITRRKADEARLRELNETLERRIAEALAERKLLADIVEGADTLAQVVDLDYRFMAINRASADAVERIYGVRPRPGDSLVEILADRPEHAAAAQAVWSRALAGEAFTVVEEFGEPGDRRWYEMKFNVLRDQDGARIGAYQFAHDVTDRLRDQARLAEAEAALRQAQKLEAMGQLTGGVAHDFNNLLTPILGALDTLQRRQVGGEREQRLVSAALQSGERAKTLVQRLLAFARRQPLQPSAVDIRTVIEGMADLVASTTGPQIRVLLDLPPDLPPARADANQLEMAILNLSVNARDAMDLGGTLRISADACAVAPGSSSKLAPGRYVRVSVCDTGVGMSEEVAAKAIEPFFSTKGVGKGTGLGLSMVHGLASQLGGGLVIDSRPGQGTTIELWLPQSEQPLAAAVADTVRPSVPRRAAGRALVVDDEDLVRISAADMLTELGLEVVEASSAEEALDLLAGGLEVDVLLTDHLMPGMSGAALAFEVGKRWPSMRTVVVSGYAEAEGIGPDLLRLHKPFRQSDLADVLARAAAGVSA